VISKKANTIIIAGASGFIGSNILKQKDLFPYNLFIPVTRRDIPGFIKVENYAESPNGDVLLYLADENSNDLSIEKSRISLDQNLETLSKLIARGYSKIIYVSSSALYGDQNPNLNTITSPIVFETPYTYLKYHSELQVLQNPNGVVVRLSNVYGPGMSRNNVISTILSQIPGAGDLQIKSIRPVRDFIWVVDVVNALIKLANMDINSFTTRVFNISTGIGTSIGELAKTALRIAEESSRNIKESLHLQNNSYAVMDYSETKKVLDWTPQVNVESGLEMLFALKVKFAQ
jgi:UDP-glucose 4-epimerase